MDVTTAIKRLALCLSLATILGCHNAGTIPPGWQPEPVSHEHTTGNTAPQGTLQVIICYGNVLPNHTALRIESPNNPPVLWDPGGTFLQHDPAVGRTHDVLTRNTPDLGAWWLYRRDGCREPIMEVFEWSLTPTQADRLRDVLINHRDPEDATQLFEPDAGGLQCCTRVSEFLIRFADDKPQVNKSYFWPHKLAEHLWTQQPDRVRLFRADHPAVTYRRDNSPVAE